jgi:PTS system fructose-specific IIC component
MGGPLAALAAGLTGLLSALSAVHALLAGLVIGVLVSIDLGGPANKAVYGFAVAGLAAGAPGAPVVMAAVMAAGMVPPLAMALATTVRAERFDVAERAAGRAAWVTGAVFVTEGAIPFAAADSLRVIPSIVAGSAVSGSLALAFGAAVDAPHGGVLVLPMVANPFGFVAALAAGATVAAAMVIVLKSRFPQAGAAGSRLGEPDEAESR